MKYSELRRNLRERGFDESRVVFWAPSAAEKPLKRVYYNIVWRGGKFIVISAGDRDDFFQLFSFAPERKPIEFDTEDEVCDWVWAKATAPKPQARKSTKTPEQLAEQSRRARERLARRVPPPPGVEV